MNTRTRKSTSRKALSSVTQMKASIARTEAAQRQAMIAEAAYYCYRAERRGFEPGHEAEDWYVAEREIEGVLTRGGAPTV